MTTAPALVIRVATVSEAAVAHAISRAAFAEYAAYPNPSSALLERLDTVQALVERGEVILALSDERPVGAGRFTIDTASGALHYERLAVHPAARGRGIGSAMIKWLETLAAESGSREVHTACRSQQPDNRPFYLQRAYEITGYSGRYGIPDLRTHLKKTL